MILIWCRYLILAMACTYRDFALISLHGPNKKHNIDSIGTARARTSKLKKTWKFEKVIILQRETTNVL